MRNLQEIYKECVQECKNAKIPIRDDKVIKVYSENDEFLDSYGICTVHKLNITFDIYINPMLLDEKCPIEELKEVVVHELIHTCPRCYSHGKTWMKYAKMMNDKYGYELTTNKDTDAIFHKSLPIIHHYFCPDCGSLYNMRIEDSDYFNKDILYQCPFCHFYYEQLD